MKKNILMKLSFLLILAVLILCVSVIGTGLAEDPELDEPNEIQLTVTVDYPERNLYVNEEYNVRVFAENATAVRAFDGWNWYYVPGDSLETTWRGFEAGTKNIYAEAYYGTDVPWAAEGFGWDNWNWDTCGLEWGNRSRTVQMDFNLLPAPAISVPGSVERGEFLVANVAELEGLPGSTVEADMAVRYRVQIRDGNGKSRGSASQPAPGYISVGTAGLAPGEYEVHVFALDIYGTEGTHATGTFTITEYTGPETVVIRLSRNEAKMLEYVALSIYAPGAEGLCLFDSEIQDLGWWSENDSWAYNVSFGVAGIHSIYAEAYYADGSTVRSEPVLLTIAAASGELGEPHLELPGAVIPAGQDMTVNYSFSDATNADGVEIIYGYTLYDAEDDVNYIFDTEGLSQSGSFTIDGAMLASNRRYRIWLYTYTNELGFWSRSEEAVFFAADGNPGDEISLTVDGQSEITVGTHENVHLNIHAPGARAVNLFNGRENDWYGWGGDPLQYDLGYDWSHYRSDTLMLYIRACYEENFDDPEAEWYYSEPLIIHVTAENGQLAAPQFSVPATVNVGDILNINVTGLDENAVWCWADVYARNDDGGIDWSDVAHGDIDADGHIYLPTAMLQPGQAYAVFAACSGYGCEDSPQTQRWFTAAGEATDDYQFTATKTEVATGETFSVVGYVPGAKELRVYMHGDNEDNWGFWGGDHFNVSNWWFQASGDHTMTLSARYTDGEWHSWEDWTDIATITMYVTAPDGDIDISGLSIPVQAEDGKDLTIDFSESGASWYSYRLWRDNEEWWNWNDNRDGNSLTIPGGWLWEGVYRYTIDLAAPGKEMAYIEGAFVVPGKVQSDIMLTVPEDDVLCAKDFEISASAPGATAISYYIPGWTAQIFQGSSFTANEQIRWAGQIVVYARACYDPIDWNSFDWNDWEYRLNWGPISAVKAVTVTAPYGTAGEPEVTGVPEIVQWNDTMEIQVGTAEHAAWYDVRIRNIWNWNEEYFCHLDGPGTVVYNTYDLTPGDYTVEVYVAGEPGYAETSVRKDFTLLGIDRCGQSNPELLNLENGSLPKGQLLQIRVPEADYAVWYHARIIRRDDNGHEDEYCFRDLGGAGTYSLPTINLKPGEEYSVKISTGAPGYYWNDTQWEEATRFTVTESSGGLYIEKMDVLVNEYVQVSVYAPGAERIRFSNRYMNENEPNWWNEDGWEGDFWQDTCSWGDIGTMTLRAEAWNGSEWTLIGEETADVTAEIILDEAYYRSLVPAIVNAGSDLSIPLPEYAEGGHAEIWDNTERNSHIYWMDVREGYGLHDVDDPEQTGDNYWLETRETVRTIVVPASYLKEGHTYYVNIDLWGGIGVYSEGGSDIGFTVINTQGGGEITLTVNGSAEDQLFLLCENYRVEVTAPGACAIRVYNGHNWDYFTGDSVRFTWSDGDDGKHVLYAQACYEDRNWDNFDWEHWDWNHCDVVWSGLSNQITLTHYATGQLDRPEAVVTNSPVVRGDFIEVKLTSYDPEAGYDAALFTREWDGNENWRTGWYDQDGDTIRIPTVDLDEGEYYVRVNGGGKTGCYGNGNYGSEPVVSVTDTNAIAMAFSKYRVETHERFTNAVRVPGAVEFTITINEPEGWTGYIDDNWNDIWQFGPFPGETTWGEGLQFDRAGNYQLKLYANYGNAEKWVYTGVYTEIEAEAEYFDLVSLIPATVISGDDFCLTMPGKATDIRIRVYDESTPWIPWIYQMNWSRWSGSNTSYYDTDTDTFTENVYSDTPEIRIPASHLKKNHTYRIEMNIGGQGVDDASNGDARFTVVQAAADGNVTLTVNGSADDRELLIHEGYEVYAHAEGANAIRVFNGWDWHCCNGDTLEEIWGDGTEGTRSIYAQAYYGDDVPWAADGFSWENWNWDGWDWNALNWSGISNVICITYTAGGEVGAFDLTDHGPVTIEQGQTLEIHFTKAEHAAEYWPNIQSLSSPDEWYDSFFVRDGLTIMLSTLELPAGEYSIRIDAGGEPGWRNRWSDGILQLTVNEAEFPTREIPAMTTPAMLSMIEEEAFEGTAARTVEISNGVWRIGERAFANSGLEQITIPDSVNEIGENAFDAGVVIFGETYSYAHQWALEHGFAFYPAGGGSADR